MCIIKELNPTNGYSIIKQSQRIDHPAYRAEHGEAVSIGEVYASDITSRGYKVMYKPDPSMVIEIEDIALDVVPCKNVIGVFKKE